MCSLPEPPSGDEHALIVKICYLYQRISSLPSLEPSKEVNALFTELVHTCIPASSIDIHTLSPRVQSVRHKLIELCGKAEGLMELHYATLIGKFELPLAHLDLFPYISNYVKLGELEAEILLRARPQLTTAPSRIAFVGSGPMPLTSIVLARNHLPLATFHNYDIDARANECARNLVRADADLSQRMAFHTTDILSVTHALATYDVVFLAALVGMDIDTKVGVMRHLSRYMAPGAALMLRSATGARAFLYPVVEIGDIPSVFEPLSIYHPTGEVINTVLLVIKREQRGDHALEERRRWKNVYAGESLECVAGTDAAHFKQMSAAGAHTTGLQDSNATARVTASYGDHPTCGITREDSTRADGPPDEATVRRTAAGFPTTPSVQTPSSTFEQMIDLESESGRVGYTFWVPRPRDKDAVQVVKIRSSDVLETQDHHLSGLSAPFDLKFCVNIDGSITKPEESSRFYIQWSQTTEVGHVSLFFAPMPGAMLHGNSEHAPAIYLTFNFFELGDLNYNVCAPRYSSDSIGLPQKHVAIDVKLYENTPRGIALTLDERPLAKLEVVTDHSVLKLDLSSLAGGEYTLPSKSVTSTHAMYQIVNGCAELTLSPRDETSNLPILELAFYFQPALSWRRERESYTATEQQVQSDSFEKTISLSGDSNLVCYSFTVLCKKGTVERITITSEELLQSRNTYSPSHSPSERNYFSLGLIVHKDLSVSVSHSSTGLFLQKSQIKSRDFVFVDFEPIVGTVFETWGTPPPEIRLQFEIRETKGRSMLLASNSRGEKIPSPEFLENNPEFPLAKLPPVEHI